MQTKKQIEKWHSKKDAWGYTSHPDDLFRKNRILSLLKGNYKRALDIGAGEGWITKDLPAQEIHAIELSDIASSRFPSNVKRVHEPDGMYDLVIATGVFYKQYDWRQFHQWILKHANGTILTSNIKSWEHLLPLTPIHEEEFKYREYTQHLCIYSIT